MLQYRSIYPETLELLKELNEFLNKTNFALGGGTAIALYLGHRISIDLDFFTQESFDETILLNSIMENFQIQSYQTNQNTINVILNFPNDSNNFINVDLLKYGYKLINPVNIIDGISILNIEDLIPMKLSAIANRGSKKDFYDFYYLLQNLPFKKILELYNLKFSSSNNFHLIKSLTYFDDAESDPSPIIFENISWEFVKKSIVKSLNI